MQLENNNTVSLSSGTLSAGKGAEESISPEKCPFETTAGIQVRHDETAAENIKTSNY